jgi:hypothetical protein
MFSPALSSPRPTSLAASLVASRASRAASSARSRVRSVERSIRSPVLSKVFLRRASSAASSTSLAASRTESPALSRASSVPPAGRSQAVRNKAAATQAELTTTDNPLIFGINLIGRTIYPAYAWAKVAVHPTLCAQTGEVRHPANSCELAGQFSTPIKMRLAVRLHAGTSWADMMKEPA